MPIEFEYIPEGIYVFHWLGIIRPQEAQEKQTEALQHAQALHITRSVQVIDMQATEMVVWDINAFRHVVAMNMNVSALLLVQPPRYMLYGAKVIQVMTKTIALEIFQDYNKALEHAHTLIEETNPR